ncbi:hypothetical protein JKF63_04409 [Porcisia hertigi]|uniref:Uncharacterized protein n=1 Tax=Porcisia hertigi TaxID=2761500 RepID=A0A836IGH6_9TRYP|nr:hypothetical protein JKF63_04409 [Porcisia hertigi]
MSTSRKRYRPLDCAEQRAVTVHERMQLLLLEDEQSYCFSWPEVPLTQWLQENVTYASLYQLYANAGGGASGAVASHTMRGQSSCLGDAGMTSPALDFPQGKSRVATSSSSGRRDALDVSPPTGLMSFSGVTRHQRSIEVPPVFLFDDFEPLAVKPSRVPMVHGDDRPASGMECNGGDVACLVRRVRGAIDALQHNSIATASVTNVEGINVEDGASPPTVTSPGIVVQSDAAARAIPHPLAPPRPQSITEDSIFSLSAIQLADLEAADVSALYVSSAQVDAEGSLQHAQALHTSMSASFKSPSENALGAASSAARYVCDGRNGRQGIELTESARREIENEVVGLEWRTWLQSQRTASALQRLLSLEAAVPFESSGDARRDAWRAAVYRLWLQWRQHRPPPIPEKGAAGGSAASSTGTTAAGLSASGVRSVNKASYSASASVTSSSVTAALGTPTGFPVPSHTKSHPPWGAPLLAGAYLYGTSNDYFIGLPPSTTNPTANANKSGSGNGGSSCGSSLNPTTAASLWPAMSRRRGAYSFLRWKVELYEAQLSQTRPTADDDRVAEGDVDDTTAERDKGKGVESPDRNGNGSGSAVAATVRRYSKGPLRKLETDASAPTHCARHSGDDDRDGSASSTSYSPGRRAGVAAAAAASTVVSPSTHIAINGVMSVSHMKALLHKTVLTKLLTEVEMDDEPTTVMERLACTDLRRDTDAWRVWLSRV